MSQDNTHHGEHVTLKKALGTKEVIAVGFGIGVCISTWGAVLIGVGTHGFGFLLSVIFAIVVYVFLAMSYSELATIFPKASSIRTYLETAFSNKMGMFVSMIYLLSFACGVSAEVIFASYLLNAMVPSIPWQVWGLGSMTVFGLIVNLLGVNKVGEAAEYLVYVVTGISILAIVQGLTGFGAAVQPDFTRLNTLIDTVSAGGFVSAFLLAMWLFAGFECVCPMAEECHTPQKALPIGMFATVVFIGILKLLFGVAGFLIVDPDVLVSDGNLKALGNAMLGDIGTYVMIVMTLGAVSSTCVSNYSSNTRVLYGMALKPNNMVPEFLAWLHPKFRTPWKAIFFWYFITMALVIGFGDSMTTLLYVGSFVWLLQYVFVLIALIKLRSIHPELPRPFKVPGPTWKYPLVTILALVILVVFMTLSVVPPYGDTNVIKYGGSLALAMLIYTLIWTKINASEDETVENRVIDLNK